MKVLAYCLLFLFFDVHSYDGILHHERGPRTQSQKNQALTQNVQIPQVPQTSQVQSTTPSKKSDWTLLIYMQANNNLSPFALKNFRDMVTIGSNEKFSLVVQWLQPTQKGIWRYKIEKEKMVLDMFAPSETDGNSSTDLIDAMRWAVGTYPANHYGLVLWDHGIGILDPPWGRHGSGGALNKIAYDNVNIVNIDSEIMATNPRIDINGLTLEHIENLDGLLTLTDNIFAPAQRGILFNEQSRTYMDNANLCTALKVIHSDVLKGKKIDFLGMDACLMAMAEVGYLARQYAEVLVGSQEVELAHGWPYELFLSALAHSTIDAKHLAIHLVTMFETFYKDKAPFYTQSAIDLTHMNSLKDSLNAMIKSYQLCKLLDSKQMLHMLATARKQCIQFSINHYIDLYSFLEQFDQQCNTVTTQSSLANAKAFQELRSGLKACMAVIDHAVFAKTAGKKFLNARGISIYFPQAGVDPSYPKTDFAHDCLWYSFIEEFNKPVLVVRDIDLFDLTV